MADIETHATDIIDQLPDEVDVDRGEVEERLRTLINDYQVPSDEARRSVLNGIMNDAGIDRDDLRSGNKTINIEAVTEPEEWVDMTAKVVDLWEPRSDSIAQVGLLGDETGTIKFTKWAKSDLPELVEGRVYRLGNVVTDEYQGRFSVKLNRTTSIEEVDIELEVGDNESEFAGALVDVQSGSGLIKRCPEEDCTRVLQNGRCSEHGDVEGEFDLRIKGVLDNGDRIQEVIFDEEATTALTGIDLEEAKSIAMDALDTSIVAETIREQTIGRYYRVSGPIMGRYLLVNEATELTESPEHEDILIKARSL